MKKDSFPEPSFTLVVRIERHLYVEFEKLCRARSLEVSHTVRTMLQQVVQDGTLVRVLHTVDDDGGHMPYGLIEDMVLGMQWRRKRGGSHKFPPLAG